MGRSLCIGLAGALYVAGLGGWMRIRLVIRRLCVRPCRVGNILSWRFDHEIFSTVIHSLPLIQEGQLSVSGEIMCTILVNCLED